MDEGQGEDLPGDVDVPEAPSRRSFMQTSLLGAATLGGLGAAARATAQAATPASAVPTRSTLSHHYLPANSGTLHWGYFSKKLKPVVEIQSGDFVTMETVARGRSRPF